MRRYEDEAAMLTALHGSGRSVTDPGLGIPLGYLPVRIGNKYVLLTRKECIEILKKGKKWRKVMAGQQGQERKVADGQSD